MLPGGDWSKPARAPPSPGAFVFGGPHLRCDAGTICALHPERAPTTMRPMDNVPNVGIDLGPLGALVCWENLLLSTLIYVVTRSIKIALLSVVRRKWPSWEVVVKESVLPLVPILLGAFCGAVVPL